MTTTLDRTAINTGRTGLRQKWTGCHSRDKASLRWWVKVSRPKESQRLVANYVYACAHTYSLFVIAVRPRLSPSWRFARSISRTHLESSKRFHVLSLTMPEVQITPASWRSWHYCAHRDFQPRTRTQYACAQACVRLKIKRADKGRLFRSPGGKLTWYSRKNAYYLQVNITRSKYWIVRVSANPRQNQHKRHICSKCILDPDKLTSTSRRNI